MDQNKTETNEAPAVRPSYEPPLITDQGSLTELTLATNGTLSDGTGFGGGGS
jgi:hypothetical protein